MLALACEEEPLENIGYAIFDAEGDGLPKLLIGALTEDGYNTLAK